MATKVSIKSEKTILSTDFSAQDSSHIFLGGVTISSSLSFFTPNPLQKNDNPVYMRNDFQNKNTH